MSAAVRAWPRASVTGIGSLPGDDPVEAAAMIFGELPDLPHLAELPARGVGAEVIGRSASLLVDLPVQVVPSGWRFTARAGVDLRRAQDWLRRDLDAVEQAGARWAGSFKIQVVGPVTLAASTELAAGHRALSDLGAVADIAASLAAGVAAHVADVQARLPAATIVVQFDEPSLPAALAARIPTASGYGTLRSLDPIVARDLLTTTIAAAQPGTRVVHCCAADAPVALLIEAGASAVALDLDVVSSAQLDQIGAAVDDGVGIWLGAVSPRDTVPSAAQVAGRVGALWNQLGFPVQRLSSDVVVTPGCGLAAVSPAAARQMYEVLRETGRLLDEQ